MTVVCLQYLIIYTALNVYKEEWNLVLEHGVLALSYFCTLPTTVRVMKKLRTGRLLTWHSYRPPSASSTCLRMHNRQYETDQPIGARRRKSWLLIG